MATYNAYYKGKVIEVKADTSFNAQSEAAKKFKARKPYEVTVVLVQRDDGTEVTHSTASI